MKTAAIETIPEAGLTVMKGVFDATLMEDYVSECEELFQKNVEKMRRFTKGRNSRGEVFAVQGLHRQNDIAEFLFPAIRRVLDEKIPKHKRSFNINMQEARSRQSFHSDWASPRPLYLIYPQGEGSLDYAIGSHSPESAEEDHTSIPLEAGDLVIQEKPEMKHRGSNSGDSPRITTVVY